ncbi:MAG: AbiV family abortive infection protein, partial [candidate division Zixibacteria bacterium]|nr:AbiV family abortive infection protein [candidate division Zixibacteria bacterium]
MDKKIYYDLYNKAHNNAVELLKEAELLYDNKRYSRSYFLAFTGLEEISKSQLAADVYTGLITENKFNKRYLNHKKKIESVRWASLDAEDYMDIETEEYLKIQLPSINKRMDALYTNLCEDTIKTPITEITSENAKSL